MHVQFLLKHTSNGFLLHTALTFAGPGRPSRNVTLGSAYVASQRGPPSILVRASWAARNAGSTATVAKLGPIGVVRLADRLGRDYTTVSRPVARLEELGLVRRRVSTADRRTREPYVISTSKSNLSPPRRKLCLLRRRLNLIKHPRFRAKLNGFRSIDPRRYYRSTLV